MDSQTIKKAERRRIDVFELWCWKRLLRVPWTARRSNQSILKAISPGCSLEGLMLKLKLQYFGHLMWRTDSFEKTQMLGKIEGGRKRGQHRMRWLDGITDSMDMSLGKLRSWWWTGRPGVLQFMGLQRVAHNWMTELNWTEMLCKFIAIFFVVFFFPLGHNFKHYTSPLLWFINFLPKDYLLGQTLVKFLWTLLLAIHCPWPTKPGFSKEFLLSIYWESPNPLYPINLLFPFIFD